MPTGFLDVLDWTLQNEERASPWPTWVAAGPATSSSS